MTNHLPTVPFAPSSCELGQNRARSFHKARDRFTERPIMCGKNARCIFLGPAASAPAYVAHRARAIDCISVPPSARATRCVERDHRAPSRICTSTLAPARSSLRSSQIRTRSPVRRRHTSCPGVVCRARSQGRLRSRTHELSGLAQEDARVQLAPPWRMGSCRSIYGNLDLSSSDFVRFSVAPVLARDTERARTEDALPEAAKARLKRSAALRCYYSRPTHGCNSASFRFRRSL
jgi:hypothetical protein